ncbi:MAG: biotin/lipoyl-binding protein [Rhodoferax sp.]|uniref:efflux RND transporter periplasmic adaptor subunit n=1 Tax=Rhodoferax sp. TaxID=50421 RepID=UPI0008B53576|nr:biotin/lipoyl-binding protein [Rhodoferax sp.]MDP2677453.1 biotin/lipoyl-binding protein [Rhodoferax sp.]OGB57774.1 MAG: multidrug transporter [Burkholderiales bacterium RIFOXYD12_FULL_59_19]OGB82107.1 MAG: multidrug transporter [Burkholderiales bacterium RIFOXYC12_FULL_60_6]
MNSPTDVSPANLSAALEARARACNTLSELGFSMANDAYSLLTFRQALVFAGGDKDSHLLTVSGLARPTEDSPYLVWLHRTWPWLRQQLEAHPGWFVPPSDSANIPPGVLDGWNEWWPNGVFALALRRRTGEIEAWVCFLLEQAPHEHQIQALTQVAQTWSYCWEMLSGPPKSSWSRRWHQSSTPQRSLIALLLGLLFFLPIHQTALAPAEVIALDSAAIASPLDGVIKTIHVRPNQAVRQGQLLFSLDDTTLRNRLQIAQKSIAVADAELLATSQKAFDSAQSKGDLALLGGRAYEKRAELAAVQAQLARIDIVASHDGIAVFGDPDDWLGRPVSTGERIMQLANPARPGVLIHLPVSDAIALEPGATVKLFLTIKPLSPLDARIIETSYQAVLSSEGIASYRLRAVFDDPNSLARIGIRGTAKVYGDQVFLGYYLLRRPLATLREWSGW